MKISSEFLKKIPACASVFYTNRTDETKSCGWLKWSDMADNFKNQFLDGKLSVTKDDGSFDSSDVTPSFKKVYLLKIGDDKEFSEVMGTE